MNHLTRFPRKTQSALVAMIAAALPASGFGAVAGHVNFAYGPVIVTSNDGGKRKITRGSPIQPGDTIDTHAGMAQIRFKDGGFISLKSQSRFQVEEYNFSGKEDGTERSFFNLIKGGFRTITGLIGGRNKKAYRVRTPVATIGIRGTAYRASYGTHMSMFITDGGIQLCNLGGCSNLQQFEGGNLKDADSIVEQLRAAGFTITTAEGDSGGDALGTESSPPPTPIDEPVTIIISDDTSEDGNYEPILEALAALDADNTDNTDNTAPSVVNAAPDCSTNNCAFAFAWAENDDGAANTLYRFADTSGQITTVHNDNLNVTSFSGATDSGQAGTNTVVGPPISGTQYVSIGTWHSGISTGVNDGAPRYFDGGPTQYGGLAYAEVDPTPVGTLSGITGGGTYEMRAHTIPSVADPSGSFGTNAGAFQSAVLGMDWNFTSASGNASIQLNYASTTYNTGNIPIANSQGPAFQFEGTKTFFSGSGCSSGCYTGLTGAFGGPNAEESGFAYKIDGSFSDFGISGAGRFERTSLIQ